MLSVVNFVYVGLKRVMIEVIDRQDIWPYTLYRKKYKSQKFELKNDGPKNPLFCLKSTPDNSNRPKV